MCVSAPVVPRDTDASKRRIVCHENPINERTLSVDRTHGFGTFWAASQLCCYLKLFGLSRARAHAFPPLCR